MDEEAEKNGDLIIAIIREVRHDKAEKKLPLNAPIKNLTIYAGNRRERESYLLSQRRHRWNLESTNIEVLAEKNGEGRQIGPYDVYVKVEY